MDGTRSGIGAAVVVAALAGAAFGHGGEYVSPGAYQDPGPPLGPPWHPPHFRQNDPEVTPDTPDPRVPITRWETWWANNKEALLRLASRMEGDAPGATASAARSQRETDAEAKRIDAVRKRLTALFVEALSDRDFEVRTAAAIALGKSGSAEGSAALRRAAEKDEHKDVRDSAVLGLGLLGQPADIPFLDAALFGKAGDARHRAFAAFALGLIGGDDAAFSLLRFADERSEERVPGGLRKKPDLGASVWVAMGLTGSRDVLPALRAAFADTELDPGVRSFVLISLGRMADGVSQRTTVTALVSERDPGLRRAAAVALGRMTKPQDMDAIAALVAAAGGDRDLLVRHLAAISLGGIESSSVRSVLREMFRLGDDAARPFAALALALQKDADFAPEIRAALGTCKDDSASSSYCIALGLLADAGSAAQISKVLASAKSVWLEGYAALSLGLIGSTSSIEALRAKLVGETDPRLRMNLAVALGMLHDPGARTYLVESMRKADTFYERSSAALALGQLRMRSAVMDLEVVYRDPKEKDILRAFAVVALGEIADPSPVPKLSRFAAGGNYDASPRIDPLNEILTIY